MKKISCLIFFAVLFLYLADPAFAQQLRGLVAKYSTDSILAHINGTDESANEPQDGYYRPSVETLSKLYWALGMFDEKNDTAIEQYLFVNECDLYNKFSGDAEQWGTIKESTRVMLCRKKDEFATRLQVMIPVTIGAYDPAKKEFDLDPASAMNDMKTVDISSNTGTEICGSKEDFKSNPRNIIINLAQPFTLKALPASPELTAYINDARKTSAKTVLFLRLKTRVGQYVNTMQFKGSWHAVVTGAIDGYEIYNDQNNTKILFTQSLPKVNLVEHASQKVAAAKTAADGTHKDAAAGGNLSDLYTADTGPAENDGSAPEDDPCGGLAKGALP